MRRRLLLTAALACSALAATALVSLAPKAHAAPAPGASSRALAQEEEDDAVEIALDAAPAAVREAVKKLVGGGTIERVERGPLEYEVDYLAEGVRSSVQLAPDGALLELERDVAPAALPPAVRSALEKRFPGMRPSKADAVQSFFYEVVIETPAGRREVRVSASGAVAGREEGEEHEDEEHEGD